MEINIPKITEEGIKFICADSIIKLERLMTLECVICVYPETFKTFEEEKKRYFLILARVQLNNGN